MAPPVALTPGKVTRTVRGAGAVTAVQIPVAAATDATNGNSFVNTGHEILHLVTDGSGRTVVINDVNGNGLGTVTLAASKEYAFGPFPVYTYGSTVVFKTSNAAVTANVIALNELDTVSLTSGG